MHVYTPEQIQFIKKHIKGCSFKYLYEYFNAYFDLSVTFGSFRAALHNRKLRNGRDCRFHPGQVSHYKGRKGYYAPGSEKGWFRPGHPGYKINEKPLGSERITRDGYVEVKISSKSGSSRNRWKGKHVLIWEHAHGPVPKGHAVIFADRNKFNFSLDNLLLLSRNELVRMNYLGLISTNKNLTRVGKTVAALRIQIAEKKRAIRRKR